MESKMKNSITLHTCEVKLIGRLFSFLVNWNDICIKPVLWYLPTLKALCKQCIQWPGKFFSTSVQHNW